MILADRLNWPQYALELAYAAAKRSEDPFIKVGAAILREDMSVASVGYNGAPAGIVIDWQDRNSRRPYVIHAEANALRYATIKDTKNGLLAVTHHPCATCLTLIAAHNFKHVVFGEYIDGPNYPRNEIQNIASILGIKIDQIEKEKINE